MGASRCLQQEASRDTFDRWIETKNSASDGRRGGRWWVHVGASNAAVMTENKQRHKETTVSSSDFSRSSPKPHKDNVTMCDGREWGGMGGGVTAWPSQRTHRDKSNAATHAHSHIHTHTYTHTHTHTHTNTHTHTHR